MRWLMLLVLFALAIALPAAAQTVKRAAPFNDNLASPGAMFVYAIDGDNVDEATIETGEALPPCTTGPGHSVWYLFGGPAGATLIVDTSQSNYDTVVAVWRDAVPRSHSTLTNLACDDDGVAPAVLEYTLPYSGLYVVSISSSHSTASGRSLVYQVFAEVPDARVPKGSTPELAVPLKLNGTVKVSGIEYALANIYDQYESPSCAPESIFYNTWFRVTVPYNAQLTVSTEGSLLGDPAFSHSFATVTAYPPGSLFPEQGCGAYNAANSAGEMLVTLTTGEWMVRVSTSLTSELNLTRPSRYKVRTRLRTLTGMASNGNFEATDPLQGWKVKNASGDGIVSGSEAIGGSGHSFKFVGGPGEKSQIQYTSTPLVPFPVDNDSLFQLTLAAGTSVAGEPWQLSLAFSYADGTTETFKLKTVTGTPLSPVIQATPKAKKMAKKIKIGIKYMGPTAIFIVDNIDLSMTSLASRGVLPPP